MKIAVGRLKQIIQEELNEIKYKKGYKRDEDEEPEEGPEDSPVEAEEPAHIQQLKDILEKWEEAEYDSDEERWQAYAEDIQDFISGGKSEEHDCGCEHPDQSHEEWEGEEEAPEPKKKSKPKEEKEKAKESEGPKKASKSGGNNFPYESKNLEQMVYQKLITALGGKE